MTRLRVGIVGAGVITQNMHLPVLSSMADVSVAFVADVDAARAAALGDAYRVRSVTPAKPDDLPECDVVMLAIPLPPRAAYFEALARRGTAVFAEKPFCLRAEEQRRIQAAFPEPRLGCGYMRRTYTSNRLLRKIVQEDWFGPLRAMRIAEGARLTKSGVDRSFQDLPVAAGGGALLNLGCHMIDAALFIAGAAGYSIDQRHVVWDGETDRKTEATFQLRGLHGKSERTCTVQYCVSWLDRQPNTIELDFDNVTISAKCGIGQPVRVRPRGAAGGATTLMPLDHGATTSNQAFHLEWAEFLRGVREDVPSQMAASTCLLTTALIEDLLLARETH